MTVVACYKLKPLFGGTHTHHGRRPLFAIFILLLPPTYTMCNSLGWWNFKIQQQELSLANNPFQFRLKWARIHPFAIVAFLCGVLLFLHNSYCNNCCCRIPLGIVTDNPSALNPQLDCIDGQSIEHQLTYLNALDEWHNSRTRTIHPSATKTVIIYIL